MKNQLDVGHPALVVDKEYGHPALVADKEYGHLALVVYEDYGHPALVVDKDYGHRLSFALEGYNRSMVALSGTPSKYLASASGKTLLAGWCAAACAKRVTEE